MNPAHLHIILNHIPVIGIPFGAALLIYGFLRKSQELRTAGLLVFVAIALVTIPTFLTGKAAEDVVEDLPGVSEHLIENHERAATIALIATSILGGLSLIRLLIPTRFVAVGTPASILILALSLGVAGWLAKTANLGGQIRHPEIRTTAALVEVEDRHDDGDKKEQVEPPRNEEPREDDDRRKGRGRHRRGRDR
jgi:hypothetical protein